MEGVMGYQHAGGGRIAASGLRSGFQLPLAMASEGQTVTVARVRGPPDLRQRMAEMGFVQGAKVKVVSRVNGDVVASVKGATLALNRDMAMRVVTC